MPSRRGFGCQCRGTGGSEQLSGAARPHRERSGGVKNSRSISDPERRILVGRGAGRGAEGFRSTSSKWGTRGEGDAGPGQTARGCPSGLWGSNERVGVQRDPGGPGSGSTWRRKNPPRRRVRVERSSSPCSCGSGVPGRTTNRGAEPWTGSSGGGGAVGAPPSPRPLRPASPEQTVRLSVPSGG